MDERKEKILRAAKKRFERFGVKKTTMDEVAGDAGISKKTLYELFRSKDELFVSVFIRETLNVRELFLNEIALVDDPLEKIIQLFRAAVRGFREDSFLVRVLKDDEGLYVPFLKEQYRLQVEEGILEIISGILDQGVARGVIRPLKTWTASYLLFKIFQSVSYAKTASIKGDGDDLTTMLDLILRGIAVDPGSAAPL